jgi:glycosyltransferase involved in cell wall biosynthesis
MIAYTYYESDPRVIREAEAALSGGFDVDFVALKREGQPPIEIIRGVRVARVAQSRYRGGGHLRYLASYVEFFLRCLVQATVMHLRRRYAAIHVNNMPDFLVFSTLIPRLLGAKVILDIHDSMPSTFATKFKSGEKGLLFRLLLWEERLSAAYCDRVITVHHPVRDGILVKHGIPLESIEVIANFADGDLFRLRDEYAVGEIVRFAFHGTIVERAGLRVLMEALARLRHKDRVRVRIIGEGDFSRTLSELIQSLDLGRVVEFDNRSYPVRAIPDLLADCHVGLVPLVLTLSTDYALPLKLVEYVVMGLPVVTIRSAAISYYFKDEDCIFYQWDDPESLRAAIDGLVEDRQRLLHYRERSVAIRHRFLWSGEKQRYIELLRELSGTPVEAPV